MVKHDIDVRNLVLSELNSLYSDRNDTKIINEMGLIHGKSRIDIAVINETLHGYELKSESDSLRRLGRQVEYYSKIFERMTLIIDRKFLEPANTLIPKWWGISVLNSDYSKTVQIRKGRKIKTRDYNSLLAILWKKELDGLVDYLDYPKKYKKYRKDDLYRLILKDKRRDYIKIYIYRALKNRNYN